MEFQDSLWPKLYTRTRDGNMLTTYLILNLLLIVWVLLDYIINDGRVFIVDNSEEVVHAVVLLSIPPINIILLMIIMAKHAIKYSKNR